MSRSCKHNKCLVTLGFWIPEVSGQIFALGDPESWKSQQKLHRRTCWETSNSVGFNLTSRPLKFRHSNSMAFATSVRKNMRLPILHSGRRWYKSSPRLFTAPAVNVLCEMDHPKTSGHISVFLSLVAHVKHSNDCSRAAVGLLHSEAKSLEFNTEGSGASKPMAVSTGWRLIV